jgi:hypothetical protein
MLPHDVTANATLLNPPMTRDAAGRQLRLSIKAQQRIEAGYLLRHYCAAMSLLA